MVINRVFLVSGGLDSFLATRALGVNEDDRLAYIDYGQPYAANELQAVARLYEAEINRGLLDCSFTVRAPIPYTSDYIAARNLTLASIANMAYRPRQIVIAGMKDDNCKDKTPEAFDRYSTILSEYSEKPVRVVSPFWNTTKFEAIQQHLEAGWAIEQLQATYSCYSATTARCGKCAACFRWHVALAAHGIASGVTLSPEIIATYKKKFATGNYDQTRIENSLKAIT